MRLTIVRERSGLLLRLGDWRSWYGAVWERVSALIIFLMYIL